MSVVIKGIEPDSPAQRAGIQAGEILVSLNGHDIIDILDYRFYRSNTYCFHEKGPISIHWFGI